MNKLKLFAIGVFIAVLAVCSFAQGVDPCVLVGKETRAGVAAEVWRGQTLNVAGHSIEVSDKISLNALVLTTVSNQSFGTATRFDDKTVYTGFALGYDFVHNERVRVKGLLGYTANMANPTQRIRSGDWGAGVAISYRF